MDTENTTNTTLPPVRLSLRQRQIFESNRARNYNIMINAVRTAIRDHARFAAEAEADARARDRIIIKKKKNTQAKNIYIQTHNKQTAEDNNCSSQTINKLSRLRRLTPIDETKLSSGNINLNYLSVREEM